MFRELMFYSEKKNLFFMGFCFIGCRQGYTTKEENQW